MAFKQQSSSEEQTDIRTETVLLAQAATVFKHFMGMRSTLTVKAVQKAKENSRVILTEFLNQVSELVLWI